MELTKEVAAKVVETVNAGLCKGMGQPVPGQMCVEAAVCYAMGLPHSDEPECVGSAVRAFKIELNDKNWSSDQARAIGMRRVAVAQLGSNEIDQEKFRELLALGTINKIVPIALRAAASAIPAHKDALESAAVGCEVAVDLVAARGAAQAARKTAAYAAATAAAAYAADSAAYAAAATAATTAATTAAATTATTAAATAAAYATATTAADKVKARDSVLSAAAEVAVQALIKLGCKGTQWLDLCE